MNESIKSSSPAEFGLSPDQFYRRVRLLRDAGLINPDRGKRNRIILSSTDASVLRDFAKLEQNYPERSLEWCLERFRADLAKKQLEVVESQVNYLRAENTALRKALVRYRRWSVRRVWERFRSLFLVSRRERD